MGADGSGRENRSQTADTAHSPPDFSTPLRCARNDKEEREAAFGKSLNSRYPIEIKQKEHVGGPDIDAFEAMMIREERAKGFFVAFGYLEDALREVGAFFRKTGKSIIALTVRDILDEEIASKLA